MKIGDLVIRKVPACGPLTEQAAVAASEQRQRMGHGLILTKQIGGSNPSHPCITVYYPKTGQIYDIAESLMEVISECR